MDNKQIQEALTSLLTDVATKARKDALAGESDMGSIFRRGGEKLQSLDPKAVEDAIIDIKKATATKEGTRRLMDGIMLAARTAAKLII